MTNDDRSIATLVIAALAVLAIGAAVYLFGRPAGSAYLLQGVSSFTNGAHRRFGIVGDVLPTFAHTYTFILLTVVCLLPTRLTVVRVCLFWFAVETAFELAQIDAVGEVIARNVPQWFSAVPVLENTADYFSFGTFDFLDIFSIAAGAFAAYLTILISQKGAWEHAPANDIE